ncbi:hypothetical protein INT45_008299 [Circinella minor]|uniref:Amino acid transporter transmembrane domain-containing protein n=1 Tax=Circinella minor TaxID=1195481 RepID=A0A8H7VJA5_9FUNG|nr:hypothetical protein INT45_008299 [Circinella minor]
MTSNSCSSASDDMPASPVDIRIPNNARQSYYGAIQRPPGAENSVAETAYFSPTEDLGQFLHQDHSSRPRSLRETLGSLAESYSRSSVIYVAENLSSSGYHRDNRFINDEEAIVDPLEPKLSLQQQMQQVYSRDSILNDSSIYKTLSQRTAPPTTTSILDSSVPLSRHATVASVISEQLKLPPQEEHKKSTFVQSVFNAMNVLIGVGILAFPLAFRYAGWLIGSAIFIFCAIGTNYTAKILARSLDAVPGAFTYGDMGMAAFGERGRAFIGSLFYVELATMGVAMVTLLGDGLQALYPSLDLVTSRILCFCLMTPFEFLSLRKLSVASLFGIISCVSLMVIVLFDGLSKTTQPGSLWDPMETELLPSDPSRIPLSFGLMMAGFAGHAVFPAIYRDMENPKKYDQMVDITYVLTISVYALMAISGYLMFGSETMHEITQNLAITDGYYKIFNYIALWLVVITPIAKFALIMNPLNVACELWIQARPCIETWLLSSSAVNNWKQNILTAIVRLSITAVLVYIALVFPGFDRVMSLLGALFSFGISVIFPLMCYQRLYGQTTSIFKTSLNISILAVAISMAAVGTIWSLLPHP